MECTLRKLKQKSLTKAEERATSAEDCRRVSVGVCVQQYSVQCKGRRGGSMGGVVAQWEAWWLNGSAPDCCPAAPGSNPASPQPTAD
jgi:hypothetical protein